MNKDNRVLQRTGARELTWNEVAHVTGAINTLTAFCSALHRCTPTATATTRAAPTKL